ncbi:GNAT family N-acetyltransferase [Phaeobacter sp. 11ANDIMAR09]|uniref:GNAT family N-acetyltransferase n=1 Tax=Phaeobacter sp. 11ANDIMAR09 TaxID=1225647 RepID=UPI0006C84A1D|nr:GNAT family N-acetyltransferase [Phaeobacter sp. 11ANDIMAR09]KPD13450.1 GCN5 family acetyltransferase [Phaeobacter sp. 11ANDIMAR09]
MVEQAAEITLRPARPEDASSLAALSIEVWLGTYLRRGINGFFADYVFAELTPQRMAEQLDRDTERFIVSQNAEGIDGFIRLTQGPKPPKGKGSALEISTLYVQPRHHGRGLGRALLQAGLAHANALGARHPWLTTNIENTPAIAFYQRQGFAITGRTHFQIGDQAYPNEVLTFQGY